MHGTRGYGVPVLPIRNGPRMSRAVSIPKKFGSEPFVVGLFAVIAASALSSVGWVLEEQAIARLTPLPVICVSNLLAGVLLIALGLRWGKGRFIDAARAVGPAFVMFSLFRCALVGLLFGYCLTLTISTKIMFLTKIEPYVVLLLQILFYGHRTSRAHLTLLGVHVVGAVILSTGGDVRLSSDTLGDFLIFVGVVMNALLYAPSQKYSHEMGALYANGLSQLLGGIALLPFMAWLSGDTIGFSEGHLVGWAYVVGTVAVFYVASTSLFFFSLTKVPAWLASALRCVGPVIAAPIAWLVYNEPLTLAQTFGALVVVVTSMWMIVLEKRSK